MKTKTKIVIGSLLAIFLLGCLVVAGVVGGFVYLFHKFDDPTLKAKLNRAKADGTEFGKTTDQNGCMVKAFMLSPAADSFDMSNTTFVNACLHASRPTANFCDGVPFVLDRKWFDDQCDKVGHVNEPCTSAFIAKRNFCQMDSK